MRFHCTTVALLLLLVACAEAPRGAPEAPPAVFPEDPDGPVDVDDACELTGPDKILAIIDVSGSLQFTDQDAARRVAVDRLAASAAPDTELAVVTLGSQPLPESPGFTPAADFIAPASLARADVLTDLQGSLRAARDLLAADMALGENASYAVVVLTDGAPAPVCCAASTAAPGPSAFGCPAAGDPDGRNDTYGFCGPNLEMPMCDDAELLDAFRAHNGQGAVAGLTPGGVYNTPETLGAAVDDILAVADDAGASLSLRFALLDNVELSPDIREIYRLDSCEARGLFTELAARSDSELAVFERAADIDLRPLVGDCAPR